MTHICVGKLTNIGSDNGLSPGRRQAIIWTNDGILLIGTLGTNFSEILIEILIFSFKKMGLKVWSAKWRTFCLGLNVLNTVWSLFRWPVLTLLQSGTSQKSSKMIYGVRWRIHMKCPKVASSSLSPVELFAAMEIGFTIWLIRSHTCPELCMAFLDI